MLDFAQFCHMFLLHLDFHCSVCLLPSSLSAERILKERELKTLITAVNYIINVIINKFNLNINLNNKIIILLIKFITKLTFMVKFMHKSFNFNNFHITMTFNTYAFSYVLTTLLISKEAFNCAAT